LVDPPCETIMEIELAQFAVYGFSFVVVLSIIIYGFLRSFKIVDNDLT